MIYKFLFNAVIAAFIVYVVYVLTASRNETFHCEAFIRTHPDNFWLSMGEKTTVIITDSTFKVLELGLESKIHAAYENEDEVCYLAENPEIHYLAENKFLFTIRKERDTCIQIFKPR